MLAVLSISAFVSAAPVADASSAAAPDLEAFTQFCKDLGRPKPVFENGCYFSDRMGVKCDDKGKLIELYFNLTQRFVEQSIEICSRIDW